MTSLQKLVKAWYINIGFVLSGYASMLALKNCLPLYLDRIDALYSQHISGLSQSDISKAEAVASPVVLKLLRSR